MATVYEATHLTLEREVALKVMSSDINDNPTFRQRFTTEAKISASLKHPHIIHIYDTGVSENQLFITMELLTSGSLKDLLESDRKLPVAHAIKIMEQLTSALSYAHERGLIHRDVKPANILFKDDSSAVLADFGIAKIENSVSDITKMGVALGSPHYMPPEQALGERISIASDIYSIGIVFYEMLTGKKPYIGENTLAVTYAHAHKPIPELPNELSQFQPVLNKALDKRPEYRFDNSKDFMTSILSAYQSGITPDLLEKTIIHKQETKQEDLQHHNVDVTNKPSKNKLTKIFYFTLLIVTFSAVGFWAYNQNILNQTDNTPKAALQTKTNKENESKLGSTPIGNAVDLKLTVEQVAVEPPLTQVSTKKDVDTETQRSELNTGSADIKPKLKVEPEATIESLSTQKSTKEDESVNEEAHLNCVLEGEDNCERFKK